MVFYIISPPKNPKSAGSMILYDLKDQFIAAGFDAQRWLIAQDKDGIFYISFDEINFHILNETTIKNNISSHDCVLIHGENLHYKYFASFNVARFYLNKIGALKNIGVPRDDEFIIRWDKSFVEKSHFDLTKIVVKKSSHEVLDTNRSRSIDLTYIGKGGLYLKGLARLSGTLEMTRAWPSSNEEYIFLLSRTRFLFTYDTVSSVNSDAVYYGAIPVFMTNLPFKSQDEMSSALGENYPVLFIEELNLLLERKRFLEYEDFFNEYRKNFILKADASEEYYLSQLPVLAENLKSFFGLS